MASQHLNLKSLAAVTAIEACFLLVARSFRAQQTKDGQIAEI
ncbi:MAG: hypothetical protein ACLP5H_10550 [Desulfomonilaceae bacterium]